GAWGLVGGVDGCGMREAALEVFASVQHLRHPDGSYWTGWQYANQAPFPRERSSWTAAAVVLAADALTGLSGGTGIFRDAADEAGQPGDRAVCGGGPAGRPPRAQTGPPAAGAVPPAPPAAPRALSPGP